MENKLNLIALIPGASTLLLIAVSVFVPWWQFSIGKPAIAQVNFSPVNFNVALFGNSLTMPLILALNIACLLTLASGGIVMLIYSVKPAKSYSKRLLGWAWKKPLYAVIFFVVEIVALTILGNTFLGFALPLQGAGTIQAPQNMVPNGANISVNVAGAFEMALLLCNCSCWTLHRSQTVSRQSARRCHDSASPCLRIKLSANSILSFTIFSNCNETS